MLLPSYSKICYHISGSRDLEYFSDIDCTEYIIHCHIACYNIQLNKKHTQMIKLGIFGMMKKSLNRDFQNKLLNYRLTYIIGT